MEVKMQTILHSEIIPQICKKNSYLLTKISDNCCQITNNDNKTTFVYYYDFNCNPNSNSWIARDKPTAYQFLKQNNVPAVEHIYVPYNNALNNAQEYLKKHSSVVIKITNGTCGNNVFLCKSISSLNLTLNNLMKKGVSICVSPYIEYDEEFRVVLCNKKPEVIYAKKRPYVIGDGISTIAQLCKLKYPSLKLNQNIKQNVILQKNIKKNLIWKHNLCNGAIIEKVNNNALKKILTNLALKACKLLNLNVCSIDIINNNGKLEILEINSGLMMENFYLANEFNKSTCLNIYEKAINSSFI